MNKKKLILNFLLASGVASAQAQDGNGVSEADLLSIGILPNSIPVLDDAASDPHARPIESLEKNPFSERVEENPKVAVEAESEELKIKRLIDNMTVHGGLMKRAGGPKILLGDLILKKGGLVPQILPDQTEQLVVRELDEEKVELAFLDTPEYTGQPRVIVIPMDIRPTVGQVLAGGNDEYLVERGRDEMAAEQQLAAVLASRATGGSIGTTIPGIKVNGKTAKRESGGGLSSLLRNYGQPGAGGIADSTPSNGGAVTRPSAAPATAQPSQAPFDFGGFQMSPSGTVEQSGAPATGSGAGAGTSAPPVGQQPVRSRSTGASGQSAAPPSFTN